MDPMSLRLCAACNRHVRESECPFCGATSSTPIPLPHSRATRAAMVFGAASMVTAIACGARTAEGDGGPGPTPTAVPVYGAPVPTPDATPPPPRDAAPPPRDAAPPPRDADADSPVAPAYGAPPDAAVPPYGAPPPRDR